MTDQHSSRVTDLDRLVRVVRRRRWLILFCFLAVTASAVGFSLLQQKEYSATASLLFRDPAIDKNLFQSAYAPYTDPTRDAATNLKLVSLPDVADSTAKQLGGGATSSSIQSKISVESEGQSDVVSVTATDRNPVFAATLANTFARRFIAIRKETDQAVIRRARELVRRRLNDVSATDRSALQSRADDLKILAALQTGKAELVQRATVPSSPSSPKPVRNGVLGAILGLILGLGLAFLFDRFDRRLRDPHELEQAYGLPVLGAIPESKALRNTSKENGLIPGPEWEAFRKLRAKLRYFNVDRKIRTVLITSAAAEEGKTTIASNLAVAAAIGGQARVLLVEADLRRPALAEKLGLTPVPGLAELLTHGILLDEATQRLSVPSWASRDATMDVIVAGAVPPNPSELLESHKMTELLEQLGATYDMVVIDTPPVSVVSDAMPLVQHVDGVIVVSRIGTSTRDGAVHLRRELESLDAPTLGLIVNRVKAGADSYYGGYGYGAEPLDLSALQKTP